MTTLITVAKDAGPLVLLALAVVMFAVLLLKQRTTHEAVTTLADNHMHALGECLREIKDQNARTHELLGQTLMALSWLQAKQNGRPKAQ